MQSQINHPSEIKKFCCYFICCEIFYSIRRSSLTAAHQGYDAFDDRHAAQQRSEFSFSGQNPRDIINDAMEPLKLKTGIMLSVVAEGEGAYKSGSRFFTLLGHGGMGKVIEAKHTETEELFAVKFSHMPKTVVSENAYKNQNKVLRDKLKEIGILKDNISDLTNEGDNALSPMCLVQIVLRGAPDSALPQDIVIMNKHGPSLYDRLMSDGADFDHDNGLAYLLGCAEIKEGLECLHSKGVAHVDIKPDNIVQSGTYNNKFIIIDFDNVKTTKIMCAMSDAGQDAINGTPPYYYGYTLTPTDNYNKLMNELQRNDKVAFGLVLLQVQCWVAAITLQKNTQQQQGHSGEDESNDTPPLISARQRPAENSSMATASSDITDADFQIATDQALKAADIISSNAKKKKRWTYYPSSFKKPLAVNRRKPLTAASGSTTPLHLPPSMPGVVTPPEPLPASPERLPDTLSPGFINILTNIQLKKSCTDFFQSKPNDGSLWKKGICSIKKSLDEASEGVEINDLSENKLIELIQELLNPDSPVSCGML